MKPAWKWAVAAAAAFLLPGCTTDPVSSGDVEYNEIRIDAFSHYWQTQKLERTSLGGGRLLKVDSPYGDSIIEFDTLVLGNLAFDKTSSLPAFVTDSSGYYGETRLVYTPLRQPKGFSCFYYNGGKMFVEQENSGTDFVLRRTRHYEIEGEEPYTEPGYSLGLDDFADYMEAVPCGYLVGKGFYLGNQSHDYYGTDPSPPGGEIVIRY